MMNQYDRKRKLKQQQNDTDDEEEQIEKALKFFDSILDEYLYDDDSITNVNTIEKSHSQTRLKNDIPVQVNKPIFKPTKVAPKNSSSGLSFQDSNYIHPSSSRQFHDSRHHFEEIPSIDYVNNVRRHTSENNLNQITSLTKSVSIEKPSRSQVFQTTATSTEDLVPTPSSNNRLHYDHVFAFMDKTNYLTENNTSASLIDLTAIDKVASRPHFRFVPPSNQSLNKKEEQLKKQQSNQQFEQYHIKPIPNERISVNSHNRYSHQIVKPTVLVPSVQKSAPTSHLAETNFHHENGKSAFKPHRSSKIDVSSKLQHTSTSSNKVHNDVVQHAPVHIGITNQNNQVSDTNMQLRQKQNVPLFHQSIPNLSQKGVTEKFNSNIYASYASDQPATSNFMKPPQYTPQSHKSNGHHSYQLPANSQDPISRWIQQVNSSSSISGLAHSSYNQPYANGTDYRSQQTTYPYGSHLSPNTIISQSLNLTDRSQMQPTYMNPGNISKYSSVPHSVPVPSAYPPTSSGSRNGPFSPPSSSSPSSSVPSNVYHFHQNNASREGQSKRHSHRQNVSVTSYL